MKIQIASKHKLVRMGTTQLRCFQPAEYLSSKGYCVTLSQLYKSIPQPVDILILHRVMADEFTKKYIEYAKAQGTIVVYDTDDLIFSHAGIGYLSRLGRGSYSKDAENENPYLTAMQLCDEVSVSVPYLAQEASHYQEDVSVLRNALDNQFLETAKTVYSSKQEKNSEKIVTLGYLSGSSSHDFDFAIIEKSLFLLMEKRPEVHLLLVGPLNYSLDFTLFGERFIHMNKVAYDKLPYLFEKIDVNLIPLEIDQEFCQGKSELKYIEAGACGVPSVASPTDIYQEVIQNNVNGILCQKDSWFSTLDTLVSNPAKISSLGVRCRQDVLGKYSAAKRADDWHEFTLGLKEKYARRENVREISIIQKVWLRLFLERKRWLRIAKSLIYSVLK